MTTSLLGSILQKMEIHESGGDGKQPKVDSRPHISTQNSSTAASVAASETTKWKQKQQHKKQEQLSTPTSTTTSASSQQQNHMSFLDQLNLAESFEENSTPKPKRQKQKSPTPTKPSTTTTATTTTSVATTEQQKSLSPPPPSPPIPSISKTTTEHITIIPSQNPNTTNSTTAATAEHQQQKQGQEQEQQDQQFIQEINAEYCLIDSLEQAKQAIETIKKSSGILAVDCEGINLGRNGKLCLIQIATMNQQAFLFDVIDVDFLMKIMDFGLREILESKERIKIMHDCRSDSDALFHQSKCTLQNVFDTQIAHAVIYRQQTGNNKGNNHTPIPISLGTLITKYGCGLVHETKETIRAAMSANENFWVHRPIPTDALDYASSDVLLLIPCWIMIEKLLTSNDKKFVAKYSDLYCHQLRDSKDGKRENNANNVPLYGFADFDIEVLRAVEYLKSRGTWRSSPNKTPSPSSTPPPPPSILQSNNNQIPPPPSSSPTPNTQK